MAVHKNTDLETLKIPAYSCFSRLRLLENVDLLTTVPRYAYTRSRQCNRIKFPDGSRRGSPTDLLKKNN